MAEGRDLPTTLLRQGVAVDIEGQRHSDGRQAHPRHRSFVPIRVRIDEENQPRDSGHSLLGEHALASARGMS